jgi:hypothetical protein
MVDFRAAAKAWASGRAVKPGPSTLGLGRIELDLLENLALAVEFGLAGGELIDLQYESQDIGVLLPAETSGCVLRHRDANAVEKIAQCQAIPIGKERVAGQGRSRFTTGEFPAMAGRTLLAIESFTALGLVVRVNAIPHRSRSLSDCS